MLIEYNPKQIRTTSQTAVPNNPPPIRTRPYFIRNPITGGKLIILPFSAMTGLTLEWWVTDYLRGIAKFQAGLLIFIRAVASFMGIGISDVQITNIRFSKAEVTNTDSSWLRILNIYC